MKSKKTKVVTSTLLLMSVGSLLAACGTPNSTSTPGASSGSGGANTYPLQSSATLGFWEVGSNNLTSFSSYDQVPFYQQWTKNTGVKMSYTIPAAGSNGPQSLSIMLASGNLPDIISYQWLTYPGGPAKAIKDGYIARLNDYINKDAPALKAYLQAHPELDKAIKTDNGDYYAFPFVRGDVALQSYFGPIIRKDWLDQLGLSVPVTIDDWHTVLTAFKEKEGATAPITFKLDGTGKPGFDTYNAATFISAFGTAYGFYLDNNGKVQFGPMQPQYKQFLQTFNQWFKEGLIDKDFATVDQKTQDSDMISGKSGATLGTAGGNIGSWMPAGKAKNPSYDIVPAPYPVMKKGDKPMLGQWDPMYSSSNSFAIAGTSNNKDLAAKVLDYGYTDAGHMFFNFGTEGTSYTMVNGYPTYTDLIMKNPNGLSPSQMMSQYIRGNSNGPFVQDKRYNEQYFATSEQKASQTVWQTDAAKHQMPPITPTESESSELATIMGNVNTLVNETTYKIIMGAQPVDSYDQFVQTLKSLNIDRAIQIEQAALDRYNKR